MTFLQPHESSVWSGSLPLRSVAALIVAIHVLSMATLALGAASGLQLSRAPIDLEYLRRDGAHLWSTG